MKINWKSSLPILALSVLPMFGCNSDEDVSSDTYSDIMDPVDLSIRGACDVTLTHNSICDY